MLTARARDLLCLGLAAIALAIGVIVTGGRGYPGIWFVGVVGSYAFLGLVVLVGGVWWLRGGRAGEGLRPLAIPLAVAASSPLICSPVQVSAQVTVHAAADVTIALSCVLLGDATAALLPRGRRRTAALVAAWCGGGLATVLPIGAALAPDPWAYFGAEPAVGPLVAWWAMLLAPVVPMLLVTALRPLPGRPLAGADDPGPIWLLAAACTPMVAMLGRTGPIDLHQVSAIVVPLWFVALVVGRWTGRRVMQARLQRDLVVAVTEAERARLAAELHDTALQELTLLVRRLDATGDAAGAALARSVSDRLRELCGDLHLPILDELGAGPALEWLVGQVAAATGEDVRLERADPARPPAGVELAVFRVAQEAISNAVKHGGSPIRVRYTTSATAATLSVDDAGPGIDVERGAIEPRPGHYGLASMQQRAEQIGGLLAIRAWPGGGTRVSLEWKAP